MYRLTVGKLPQERTWHSQSVSVRGEEWIYEDLWIYEGKECNRILESCYSETNGNQITLISFFLNCHCAWDLVGIHFCNNFI